MYISEDKTHYQSGFVCGTKYFGKFEFSARLFLVHVNENKGDGVGGGGGWDIKTLKKL